MCTFLLHRRLSFNGHPCLKWWRTTEKRNHRDRVKEFRYFIFTGSFYLVESLQMRRFSVTILVFLSLSLKMNIGPCIFFFFMNVCVCVFVSVHVCVSVSNKWYMGIVVTSSLPMVLHCPRDHELSPTEETDCFAHMHTQTDAPNLALPCASTHLVCVHPH